MPIKRLIIAPKEIAICGVFLAAIAIANIAVHRYGQVALVFTAAILMPMDFLARDILHHRWEQSGSVVMPMSLLIAIGALLTIALNPTALYVAIASALAFTVSAAGNTAVYAATKGRNRFVRMNASNGVAAVVDSVVFPLMAFGSLDPGLSIAQAVIKSAGGLAMSLIYLAGAKDVDTDMH